MKKTYFVTILIVAFISPVIILAHSDSASLADVLKEIKTSQNVSEKSQIDCDEATDEQFEKLGEAVMSAMHPDEKEHKLMDQMMGGEGSSTLKAMHILMGKKYLGCFGGTMESGTMMGGGMMGNGIMEGMTGWGIMNRGTMGGGNYFYGWNLIGLIFQVLVLVLIILTIFALIKWLASQSKR